MYVIVCIRQVYRFPIICFLPVSSERKRTVIPINLWSIKLIFKQSYVDHMNCYKANSLNLLSEKVSVCVHCTIPVCSCSLDITWFLQSSSSSAVLWIPLYKSQTPLFFQPLYVCEVLIILPIYIGDIFLRLDTVKFTIIWTLQNIRIGNPLLAKTFGSIIFVRKSLKGLKTKF